MAGYLGTKAVFLSTTAANVAGTVTAGGLTVDTDTLYVDSTNNRVGIGTAAVDSLLHLQKSDATAYSATATDGQVGVGPTIYLENSANSNTTVGGQIVFGMRSTENQARIGATGGTAPALTFGTADAEAMRISAGNLLVGKTTQDFGATGGIEFYGVGGDSLTILSRASNAPLQVRRNTTDGDIVKFQKNGGVTVGSIGNISSNLYVGNADTGLGFSASSNTLYPISVAAGAIRDAGIDLGISAARFKDLYLSGGVYLGGTQYTSRRSETGGGSLIFATLVSGKAQMGELYAYDTATNNWCHYSLKKNDQNASVTIQQISGSGLTVAATNAQGTIALSATSSTVEMVVTIWVVEN